MFEVVRERHQAQQIDRAAQFLAWAQNAEVLAFDDKSARLGGEIAGAFCGLEPRLVLLTF